MEQTGYIILLSECSNQCVFCAVEKIRENPVTLQTQELQHRQKLSQMRAQGFTRLIISGSDPIEYPGIVNLLRIAKESGFDAIGVATHGKQLSKLEFARFLIDAGADYFTIALYGSLPEIHDSVTKVAGSFKQTVEGIRNVKSLKKEVYISMMPVRQNRNDLIGIAKLAKELGVTSVSCNMTYLTTSATNAKEPSEFYIPTKDLPRYMSPLYEYLLKTNSQMSFLEFPYCLFETIEPEIIINSQMIMHSQTKYTFLKDQKSGTAPHRDKVKTDICRECRANERCDGFFRLDIERYGTGDLKPIHLS